MYVLGSNNVWFLRTTDGAIVEYSASSGARSNAGNHGEVWNLYYSGDNAVIRFNMVRDAYVGNPGTAIVAITSGGDGCQFYGNVVWDFDTTDGVIGYDGSASSRNRVYNNTFVNGGSWNQGTRWGSGTDNIVRNNVWINCSAVDVQGTTVSHNTFSGVSFVNAGGNDYRLKDPTAPGVALGAPYNTDILGNTRGADGAWDRGAYEYGGIADTTGPSVPITSPSEGETLSGVITLSATASDNRGGSGMASVSFLRGTELLGVDSSPPYTLQWESRMPDGHSLMNGPQLFRARAVDKAGNEATSTGVSVTIENPPGPPPSNVQVQGP